LSPFLKNQSLALLTDFYQLTMAYGYWKKKMTDYEAVFHLFFRRPPFKGGFSIFAGLQGIIDYLNRFQFDSSDLAYLEGLRDDEGRLFFEKAFIDYLATIRFKCDLIAAPEGSAVFPYEPLLQITGPLIQCQLLESPLLTLTNFATLIATKASRICIAARGDPVLEFGLRRAQGIDGAITATRSAYIGGCYATSNVFAGKTLAIPIKGTHAHSWVMAFENELESFQNYAEALPNNCVFLVDTYDTLEGVKNAIAVGKWLREQGKELQGIRLDSGDLAYLSIESRKLLNAAGFEKTKIIASNELDELIIADLKNQGAQIDIWGVGTHLVTGHTHPALDGVYKLSALRKPGEPWSYKLKISEQMTKTSNPGLLQVKRYEDEKGLYIGDVIYDQNFGLPSDVVMIDPFDSTRKKVFSINSKGNDLLIPIYKEGVQVYSPPPLDEIRKYAQEEVQKLDRGIKRFINPHLYPVGLEKKLYQFKIDLVHSIRNPKRD
jgi:nicotinate phosphoribosyltransferase